MNEEKYPNCSDCKNQVEDGNYLLCHKYKWFIDTKLAKTDRLCDFDDIKE